MNLKELAQTLGLSQTTVSRALNGYPEVSEATRRRVLRAADQHQYRPDTRATALATGRAMRIGHVIPRSTTHEMVNPVFADFIAGASDVYSRAGYNISLSVVDDSEQAESYRALAAKGSVDGIIVHGPSADDARISLLNKIGLPFVVHGRASGVNEPYSWIDVNNRRAFHRATEFLIGIGHRRIGLLNGLEHMDFAIRRREGFLGALAEAGLEPNTGHMYSDEMTEGYGYAAARELLALPERPTAVLVSSIIVAMGVRRALGDAGLVLGRDLSLIAHDDDLSYFRNGQNEPIFTALRSSVREAGQKAAAMLLERISNPDAPPSEEMLEADLMLGRSTGAAPLAEV